LTYSFRPQDITQFVKSTLITIYFNIMDREFQERLVICRTSVARIYSMLQTSPDEWESYVDSARSVMASIDVTPFMADPNESEEQIWVIEGLQKLAFRDSDSGGLSDIADWCLRQWLRVLQNHPQNIETLKGEPILAVEHHRLLVLQSLRGKLT